MTSIAIGRFSAALAVPCLVACQQPTPAPVEPTELAGSHAQEASPTPPPGGRELAAYAYDCAGLYVVAVSAEQGGLWLFLPERSLRLAAVPSGSGAKYAGAGVVFWSKGEHEALLQLEGSEKTPCRGDRRRSLIEDAKIRGVAYRGGGNEPGWTLEIGPDRIELVHAYGQERAVFPMVEPMVDDVARRTVYRTRNPKHELVIVISATPCRDTMSGERFDSRLEVRLDTRMLRGCGRALH